jgi:hypothetical protein
VIAAGSNNAFAINGFGGMPVTEIFSFFMMFIIFNFYAMLMTAALVSFYVTSKPRHGRVRRAAIWHFVAALFVMLSFISTVWAAPAEKSFIQNTGTAVGLGDRAHNAFIGFAFALVAIICMLIGFRQGARERRQIREEAFAI